MSIKFNGGYPVITCKRCSKIIRYATEEELLNRIQLIDYCDDCR